MNVLLFKFRCNIFIGVRIIKEMPVSVASGTHCIYIYIYIYIYIERERERESQSIYFLFKFDLSWQGCPMWKIHGAKEMVLLKLNISCLLLSLAPVIFGFRHPRSTAFRRYVDPIGNRHYLSCLSVMQEFEEVPYNCTWPTCILQKA